MSDSIQLKLIQEIGLKVGKNKNLVEELSAILNISKSAAYRRIRQETPFTIFEVEQLSNHFQISLDWLISDGVSNFDTLNFTFKVLSGKNSSFETYLKELLIESKLLASNKENQLYYVTNEIPVFHSFVYPLLSKFKIYMWEEQCGILKS